MSKSFLKLRPSCILNWVKRLKNRLGNIAHPHSRLQNRLEIESLEYIKS